MTIHVSCPNGHRIVAKDSHAGRTVKCPACGSHFMVPLIADPVPKSFAAEPERDVFGSIDSLQNIPRFEDNIAVRPIIEHDNASFHVPVKPSSQPSLLKARLRPATSSSGAAYWYAGSALLGASLGCITLFAIWLLSTPASKKSDSFAEIGLAQPIREESVDRSVLPTTNASPLPVAELKATSPPKLESKVVVSDLKLLSEKLETIRNAFLGFEDVNRRFTPIEATNLSWRVHVLPYIGEKALYEKFHLDERWDSNHNHSLIESMPEIYRISSTDETTTRFQVVTGSDMFFGSTKPARLNEIQDGIRQTILALIVGEDKGIVWTKPDELTFEPETAIASLGKFSDEFVFAIAFQDKPLVLPVTMNPADFYSLCTPRGNEVTDPEKYRRQFEEMRNGGSLATQVAVVESNTSSKMSSPKTSSPVIPKELFDKVTAGKRKKLTGVCDALAAYEAAFKGFPVKAYPSYFDDNGKLFLSWRVHLLQFVDQPLFGQFKLDEPWDSPHNLPLLNKMPELYRDPLSENDNETKTCIVTFTGPGTMYPTNEGPKRSSMKDGSNTLIFVSVSREKAVPWTKPEDLVFDSNAPIACLGRLDNDMIFCATPNGEVFALRSSIPTELFKAMVTPAGGENVPYNLSNYF